MLSQKVFYAVHALLILADQKNATPIQIKEIANICDLSLKYLETVFSQLKKAGIVQSIRGSKGGYFLIKSIDQIMLDDLMLLFDGPLKLLSDSTFFSSDLNAFLDCKQSQLQVHLQISLEQLYLHQHKNNNVLNYSI